MKGKVKQLVGSIVPEPKKLTNRKYECTVDIKKFIPNLKGEFFIEIDCHDSVHDPKKDWFSVGLTITSSILVVLESAPFVFVPPY